MVTAVKISVANMSPVRYELDFYIPEDDILHSHRREILRSYVALTGWTLLRIRNVSPVRYELDFVSQKAHSGQLDQGFPWFSLVPEHMLSWYPNSTLLCMLHMQQW
jgi:hypothetical protein